NPKPMHAPWQCQGNHEQKPHPNEPQPMPHPHVRLLDQHGLQCQLHAGSQNEEWQSWMKWVEETVVWPKNALRPVVTSANALFRSELLRSEAERTTPGRASAIVRGAGVTLALRTTPVDGT